MKKKVWGRKLSRTKNQRRALFRGLITSLINKGEIVTTLPKAKAVISEAEKLITKAKKGTLADRRQMHRTLAKKSLVNKLVDSIAPLFGERKGGYLKIIRIGVRRGDGAQMAKIAFVEDISQRAILPPKSKPEALPAERQLKKGEKTDKKEVEKPIIKTKVKVTGKKTKNVKSD